MIEKMKTGLWFLRRPAFWPHAAALARRKIGNSARLEQPRPEATQWAAERAVPVVDALAKLGLLAPGAECPTLDPAILEQGAARAARSAVKMGGPGDLELLHAAVRLLKAERVIETGVAYGWSSLAILSGLAANGAAGRLVSVDMPYAKLDNEPYVGIVVPEELRKRWTLIREPDRNGIKKAIAALGGQIDLCHYDSDKSYVGRSYGFPLLWDALRPGGIFISDDIQDNFGFRDFCEERKLEFAVTSSSRKFIGIARKP